MVDSCVCGKCNLCLECVWNQTKSVWKLFGCAHTHTLTCCCVFVAGRSSGFLSSENSPPSLQHGFSHRGSVLYVTQILELWWEFVAKMLEATKICVSHMRKSNSHCKRNGDFSTAAALVYGTIRTLPDHDAKFKMRWSALKYVTAKCYLTVSVEGLDFTERTWIYSKLTNGDSMNPAKSSPEQRKQMRILARVVS